MDLKKPIDETIVEIALINLAFARTELSTLDRSTEVLERALGHIEIAIHGLAGLAPQFGGAASPARD
jgi:hypothetical protein